MIELAIERELLARLSRALEDETTPSPARDLEIEIARDALKAFYRERGLYAMEKLGASMLAKRKALTEEARK